MEIPEYLRKCRCCIQEIGEDEKFSEINNDIQQQFYDLTQIHVRNSQF